MGTIPVGLGLVLGLAAAAPSTPRAEDPAPLKLERLGDEPLANDAYLPLSAGAREALARADTALDRSRGLAADDRPREAGRVLVEAFEAMDDALGLAGEGPEVLVAPGPPPAADEVPASTPRFGEGIHGRVRRWLAALEPSERASWRTRFDGPAAAALDLAGSGEWARVARRHPGTGAALRACVWLVDASLEAGRHADARAWLRRAEAELELTAGESDDTVRAALERRAARLGQTGTGGAPPEQTWVAGSELVPAGTLTWNAGRGRPGVTPRPGATWLADGRLAIQERDTVHLIRFRGDDPEKDLRFEPEELFDNAGWRMGRAGPTYVMRDPPGWPFLPLAVGNDLILVVGRTGSIGAPNLLVRVTPPVPAQESGPRFPRLRWVVSGSSWMRAGQRIVESSLLAQLEQGEFQPGPVVVGDQLVAQVRVGAGEVRAYLVGIDLESGEPRWARLLAQGSDLVPDQGRVGAAPTIALSAQPLWSGNDGAVIAGTHLGVVCLVDALDGSLLWGLRYRRRDAALDSWPGRRPLPVRNANGELFFAPHDSDRLYRLLPQALSGPDEGLSPVSAVLERGEAMDLVGGDPGATVLVSRAGRQTTLRLVGSIERGPVDALYLGPEETFEGRGLYHETRALVASTHGLYLFDPRRDFYLLDYEPLPRPRTAARERTLGGDVFVHGSRVVVLGAQQLWAFRSR